MLSTNGGTAAICLMLLALQAVMECSTATDGTHQRDQVKIIHGNNNSAETQERILDNSTSITWQVFLEQARTKITLYMYTDL